MLAPVRMARKRPKMAPESASSSSKRIERCTTRYMASPRAPRITIKAMSKISPELKPKATTVRAAATMTIDSRRVRWPLLSR